MNINPTLFLKNEGKYEKIKSLYIFNIIKTYKNVHIVLLIFPGNLQV